MGRVYLSDAHRREQIPSFDYPRKILYYQYLLPLLDKTFKNGCWYCFEKNPGLGYPIIKIGRSDIRVNRLIAHLFHGLDLWDESQHACHLCDTPPCIYPFHIYTGDAKMNGLDRRESMKDTNVRFIQLTKADPTKVFERLELQRRARK